MDLVLSALGLVVSVLVIIGWLMRWKISFSGMSGQGLMMLVLGILGLIGALGGVIKKQARMTPAIMKGTAGFFGLLGSGSALLGPVTGRWTGLQSKSGLWLCVVSSFFLMIVGVFAMVTRK